MEYNKKEYLNYLKRIKKINSFNSKHQASIIPFNKWRKNKKAEKRALISLAKAL